MATVKIGFVSLGCPKNLVDSQNIITLLLKSGYDVSNTYENADAVVINTCGFIESSVEESMNVINEALGSCKNVVVTGCLGPRKDFILEHYPEVKAVSGPHSPEAVLRDINALFPDYHGRSCFKVPEGGVLLTPPHYAYLKISEGCSHRCSFCVIPQIRGDLESFSPEAVLKQAEAYAKRGVKELLVVAQDTSAYGMDVKYPGFRNYERGDLYALTRELGKLGLWQRVHYAYPYPHVVKLVEQMAEGLVLPYMDVPLQHVNKRILGLMKRLDFIAEARLNRVGCFTYSNIINAAANELPDQIPEEVKQERYDRFMTLQQQISTELLAAKVGQKLDVIIDEVSPEGIVGRTKGDAPEIDGVMYLHQKDDFTPVNVGDIVKAVVTASDEYDLEGDIV